MKGILLAAGFSVRFGAADKLLHKLPDGRPLALAAAHNLLAALPQSIAVVRPGNALLARLLQDAGFAVVRCPEHALGMGDSLAAGVSCAMQEESGGFVVALADMPFIRPETIARVADALRTGAGIAAPVYRGQRGHPVGFAAEYAQELAALQGDTGARAVLARHASAVRLLECEDPGVVADIDTLADLAPTAPDADRR